MARWNQRGRRQRREARILVREAERFLDGRYVLDAVSQGQAVPAWTWMSWLAHGDADVLDEARRWLTDQSRPRDPTQHVWRCVLQLLAADLETTAKAVGCSVEEVQHAALVPIELGQLEGVGPTTFHRIVTAALSYFEQHWPHASGQLTSAQNGDHPSDRQVPRKAE